MQLLTLENSGKRVQVFRTDPVPPFEPIGGGLFAQRFLRCRRDDLPGQAAM